MATTRTVVIHYHIFKNAGSSVDTALRASFAARHGAIEGPQPWDVVTPERMADFLIAHPELDAVSSHQARLPYPPVKGLKTIPIIFLRHPIDRFGSVYEYEKKQPATTESPSAKIARTSDLRAFAEWAVSSVDAAVVRNYQTSHIAGIDQDMRIVSCTRFHYAIAKLRLKQLPAIGLVDQFDDSMTRFTSLVRQSFPEFSGAYKVENVSQSRSRSVNERIEQLQEAIGETNFKRLVQCNAYDLRLYQEASSGWGRG